MEYLACSILSIQSLFSKFFLGGCTLMIVPEIAVTASNRLGAGVPSFYYFDIFKYSFIDHCGLFFPLPTFSLCSIYIKESEDKSN